MTYLSSPYASRPCFSWSPYLPYIQYSYSPSWSWLPSWLYSPAPTVWSTPSWAMCTPPVTTTSPWTPRSSPLPPQTHNIQVHPTLAYNAVNPAVPKLQWDIISPPERAREFTGQHLVCPVRLTDEALYATEGGDITEIWIESDNSYLQSWIKVWGPIQLRRAHAQPKFTVGDVLDGIREYLSLPLITADMERLLEGDVHPYRISAGATLMRAKAMRERDEYEWGMRSTGYRETGFRRSDVLGSYRRFQGMRAAMQPDGTWKVFLGVLSGQVPRYS